jgi:hypothetical protein
MTSKISTHNKIPFGRIAKEDLRTRTWTIALSVLGSFVACPLAFLFFNTSYRPENYAMAYSVEELTQIISSAITRYLMNYHLPLQLMVAFVGALIVALYGFRHLYSRRMVDLYHSVPATRNQLFWAIYLDGFLIWFVPFAVCNLLVYALALFRIGSPAYWGGITLLLLKEIALCILCFLIVYNACLVPVMISGNAKNAFVNLLIYGFAVLLCYLICIGYMSCYLETYYRPNNWIENPLISGLSPLASPVFLGIYFSETLDALENVGDVSAASSLFTNTAIISFVVMLFNLGLARFLHQKRPSELAERGVESKVFRIALRFIVSVLAGLVASLGFRLIADADRLAWSLFGAVFGCVLTFAFMNILYHMSFKALLAHKGQLAACALVTCGILFAFRFDWFGYDTYLPRQQDITGLSFYNWCFVGEGYGYKKNADGNYYYSSDASKIPEDLVFTNQEENYQLLSKLVSMVDTASPDYSDSRYLYTIRVRVDTTHGSYYRTYNCWEPYETDDTANELLEPFITTREFMEYYYPAASGVMDAPTTIAFTSADGINGYITDSELINELYQTYAQDFAEHYDMVAAQYRNGYGLCTLKYYYPRNGEDITNSSLRCTLDIPSCYERTLSLLAQTFPDIAWSQEDLEPTALQVDISSYETGIGISSDEENSSDEEMETSSDEGISYTDYQLTRTITDADELEALSPYLYLGSYYTTSTSQYMYVGKMTAVSKADPSRTVEVSCCMERSNIPEGFVESLTKTQPQYDE